ncbi:MAG TPA: ubiquitin-like domain-containing protein [Actinomycetota bacterium]
MPVRPSRVRRLRARKAMGNVALAAAVLTVAGGYLAIQKNVTLVVDGRQQALRTMSADVGELLDAHGIAVGIDDSVVPSETTPIVDGMTVIVEFGLRAEGSSWEPPDVGVWVMEGVGRPGTVLSGRRAETWFSAGTPVGQQAVVAARVVVMGKDHDVLTNATTVRELLSAMGIEPDGNDRVRPSPRTPLNPASTIVYTSIDVEMREVEVPIPHTTISRYTDDLAPGETETVRQGVDGLMVERFRIKTVNGEAASRTLLDRTVVREAVPAKRLVGRPHANQGVQVGEASWYSFAPGEGLTAAHPSLPFGTVVTVTNLDNGKSVRVVINDRGPFGGRLIDLSEQAFARIAPLGQGVCQVRLTW